MRSFVFFLSVSMGVGTAALAQQGGSMPEMNMGAPMAAAGGNADTQKTGAMGTMTMGPDTKMPAMQPQSFLEAIEQHGGSGTSAQPVSTPLPMMMEMHGGWMLMLHGEAFILDEQQTGPRGADKLFSTNWAMPMAQRQMGRGKLTLRGMFSLEPGTITGREYPLLFQQGETAFGRPIVDGQHPHNLFMELAAGYDLRLGERTLLSFYGGPVGDPALGPAAYPHRQSASEDPVAALGHHQEDSTHIAADVVTAGLTSGWARIEASGFHGREPDESRWTINQGALDSWATRLTLSPGKNWSGQYSYGRLKSPEQLFPTEDQARTTASLMYNRPLRKGNWSTTALWGRTRGIPDNGKENSYLFESTLRFAERNYVWTRLEDAGRSNELLYAGEPLPAGFVEAPLTHVQAYTFGFDRDIQTLERVLPNAAVALGAQATTYGAGEPLKADYGDHPFGVVAFLRIRIKGREH